MQNEFLYVEKVVYGCKEFRNLREGLTEFRQPLQVQSHLEVPRILVQLGHIQRT